MKAPSLEGKKIRLRSLEEGDAEGRYPEWFNDIEVCRFNSHGLVKNTAEKSLAYIRSVIASENIMVFAIIDKATNLHIGNVSLQDIHFGDQRADLAVILGEKAYWGKGFAKEAWLLAMRHGFEGLSLHRIHCGTRADNLGMQRLALACGMREEGRLKDHVFKEGKFYDVIVYGILRDWFPLSTGTPQC